MRSWGKRLAVVAMTVAVMAVVLTWVTQNGAPVSAAEGVTERVTARIGGKPDFNGIWEANNTANWDLQTHPARPMVAQPGVVPGSVVLAAPVVGLGSLGWVPGGLGVVEGEFHWHKHDNEDEFFYVVSGRLFVDVEGGSSVELLPEQGYTVPRGVIHRTRAPERTAMLMIESAGIVPAGDS